MTARIQGTTQPTMDSATVPAYGTLLHLIEIFGTGVGGGIPRSASPISGGGPRKTYGTDRGCGECGRPLSRYNPGTHCALHEHLEESAKPRPEVHHSCNGRVYVGARPEDVAELIICAAVEAGSQRALGRLLGINEARVGRLARCESQRNRRAHVVTGDVVDRLLTALGREHERHTWGCLA